MAENFLKKEKIIIGRLLVDFFFFLYVIVDTIEKKKKNVILLTRFFFLIYGVVYNYDYAQSVIGDFNRCALCRSGRILSILTGISLDIIPGRNVEKNRVVFNTSVYI